MIKDSRKRSDDPDREMIEVNAARNVLINPCHSPNPIQFYIQSLALNLWDEIKTSHPILNVSKQFAFMLR